MSCIVALRDQGTVWIGADSAGTAPDFSQELFRTPKVFHIPIESGDGPVLLVGHVGSYRLGQLMQFYLNPRAPEPGESPEHYLITAVLTELQAIVREMGFASQRDDGREQGGRFILGYEGRIYIVQEDYDLLEPEYNFTALGEGAQVALGALWALRDQKINPVHTVSRALWAASQFCAAVRPPFLILSSAGDQVTMDGTSRRGAAEG